MRSYILGVKDNKPYQPALSGKDQIYFGCFEKPDYDFIYSDDKDKLDLHNKTGFYTAKHFPITWGINNTNWNYIKYYSYDESSREFVLSGEHPGNYNPYSH